MSINPPSPIFWVQPPVDPDLLISAAGHFDQLGDEVWTLRQQLANAAAGLHDAYQGPAIDRFDSQIWQPLNATLNGFVSECHTVAAFLRRSAIEEEIQVMNERNLIADMIGGAAVLTVITLGLGAETIAAAIGVATAWVTSFAADMAATFSVAFMSFTGWIAMHPGILEAQVQPTAGFNPLDMLGPVWDGILPPINGPSSLNLPTVPPLPAPLASPLP